MTSRQWLARVALILSLGASEVVLAAVCGVGGLRIAVLAVSALAFVTAYLVAPPLGISECSLAARPVLLMRASSLIAVIATGGLGSPLLPLLAVPVAISWTLRPRWHNLVLSLATVAVLLALLPAAASVPFTAHEIAVLAGWSTILVAWAIGRRLAQVHEAQRAQAACLARLREGALVDAASRRRGLESMTTKLAHELKNPLAAIKSLVQVELAQATDDKSRRRLEVVLGEVDRISKILREYLDLARPVEDAQVARVELGELMSDVSTLVGGRAEAAGVELTVRGSGGALHADARLLKEAIVSVVCNAIEATPRGGFVTVSYQVGTDRANIVVRDTGRGMTKEVVTRVGTPFFTTREGGTGLGVVIAKTAIAQHRGTLEYDSTPGAGTTARIALPLDPRAQERAA
jgi:signal transduction histidine kinase